MLALIVYVTKGKSPLPKNQADVIWANELGELVLNKVEIAQVTLDCDRHWRRFRSLLAQELSLIAELLGRVVLYPTV